MVTKILTEIVAHFVLEEHRKEVSYLIAVASANNEKLEAVHRGVKSTLTQSAKHGEDMAMVTAEMKNVTKEMKSMKINTNKNAKEIKEATGNMTSAAAKYEEDRNQIEQNKMEISLQKEIMVSFKQKISFYDTDPTSFNTPLFREHGQHLIDYVSVDKMLPRMFMCKAINMREKEKINSEVTSHERVARLLAILDKKPNGVDLLRQGLIESDQTQIAQVLN